MRHAETIGARGLVGLNINLNEQSLVDLMPHCQLAEVQRADSLGWPASDFSLILDNRHTFAWEERNPNQDPLRFTPDLSGSYTLSFTGQALTYTYRNNIRVEKRPLYNPVTNRSEVHYDFTGPFIQVWFQGTKREAGGAPGSGVTAIHLIRDSEVRTKRGIFTKVWFDSIRQLPWAVLRCLDVTGVNKYGKPGTAEAYPYQLNWEKDRLLPGTGPLYRKQHVGVQGIVPWEDILAVAQVTRRDLWINIPVNASPDYVEQLARLFRYGSPLTGNKGLPPDVKLYMEYSNELWHEEFPQGEWNARAAAAEVGMGNSNLYYDGSADPEVWRFRRIAKRTVEIGRQFRSVFGDRAALIRPVVNNNLVEKDFDILQYVTANYGRPDSVLYALAQQGYYAATDASSTVRVLETERQVAAGRQSSYRLSRMLATYFGLHPFIYEGGPEEKSGSTPSVADRFLANKLAAARHPAMGKLLFDDVLHHWYASGGELYLPFSQVGRYSYWGSFGLTEDLTNLHTPKWLAFQALIGEPLPALNWGVLLPRLAGTVLKLPLLNGPGKFLPAAKPGGAVMYFLRVPVGARYRFVLREAPGHFGAGIRLLLNNTERGIFTGAPGEAVVLELGRGTYSVALLAGQGFTEAGAVEIQLL